jgi:hypothetical protein
MNKAMIAGATLLLGVSISSTFGVKTVDAQGPAGSGAAAAQQGTSHSGDSLNPLKLFKKDSNSGSGTDLKTRGDYETKLTPKLQTEGLLGSYGSATEACAPYTELYDCLAGMHASHNVGVDFNCVRAVVTGVHTTADLSGCKSMDGDKALPLTKALHELKPDANAKEATKEAEQQAKADLATANE